MSNCLQGSKVMRQSGVGTLITEEPDDGIGHVRICGGDGQQWLSLPGESRKSTQGLDDAPGKIKNTLFTLLCSCIREIRASMLKTNQVTGNCSCISCIHAIHGDNYGVFNFSMHINSLSIFFALNRFI